MLQDLHKISGLSELQDRNAAHLSVSAVADEKAEAVVPKRSECLLAALPKILSSLVATVRFLHGVDAIPRYADGTPAGSKHYFVLSEAVEMLLGSD